MHGPVIFELCPRENLKERERAFKLVVDGSIILKWILKQCGGFVEWIDHA
jgi:hypothetical protein